MDKVLVVPAGVTGAPGLEKVADAAGGRISLPSNVIPIHPDSPGSIDALEKYASERPLHDDVKSWINGYQPKEGHVAFLIDALGSDAYGMNVNGDLFPPDMLAHPGRDYGYKTFEQFAYPYFHHINKGEKFSYGPKVALSTWLEDMERVQLVAWWSEERCGDLIPRLLDGELLDVSMGCRVPYDQCTYCGVKARRRSEYCDHLRLMMRRMMDNSVRVGAINWYPKFFDISFVRKGAERCSKFLMPLGVGFRKMSKTAATLSEVEMPDDYRKMSSAELGEKVAAIVGQSGPWHTLPISSEADGGPEPQVDAGEKVWADFLRPKMAAEDKEAAVDKEADIEKEISSNLNEEEEEGLDRGMRGMNLLRRCEHDMPRPMLDDVSSRFPLKSILATLMGARIMPKPKEFQRIILVSIGKKTLADDLESKGQVFDEHADVPEEIQKSVDPHVSCCPKDLSEDLFKMLAPLLEARSFHREPMARRSMVIVKRAFAGMPATIEPDERKSIPMGALALGLAAFHGAFKRNATHGGVEQIGIAARKNPAILALLVSLGVAAVEANRQINMSGAHPFGSGMVHEAHEKVAIPLAARLAGMPAMYLYSDFQEADRRRGRPPTGLSKLIHEHPDVASLAWFFGSPHGAKALAGLTRGAKGMVHTASAAASAGLAQAIGDSAVTYGIWQKKALPLAMSGAVLDTAIFKGLESLLSDDAEHAKMSTLGG